MSSPYGHQQPGYSPHGHVKSADSGMKTCLVIGAVIGGIGLMLILVCGGGAFLIGRSVFEEVSEVAEEAEEEFERIAEQLNIDPPHDLDEAIVYLNKDDERYHRAAAEWLASQPLQPSYQSRVNKGLTMTLESSDSMGRAAAVRALKVWADASVAEPLAQSLRPGDSLNRDKLEILGRLRQVKGVEHVVELLGRSSDAEAAYQALQQIGPAASPFVAEHLSESDSRGEYARQLLSEWGVDIDKSLIESYVRKLNGDDESDQLQAAEKLSRTDFMASMQPQVATALNRVCQAGGRARAAALNALVKWGDESSQSIVKDIIEEGGSDTEQAIEVIGKIGDESAYPVIVKLLAESGSVGDAAAEALISFGKDAHPAVLPYFNDPDDKTRDRARRVLAADRPDRKLLFDQCIDDLYSGEDERAVAAAKWLGDQDVDEELQPEVASAIAQALDTSSVFDRQAVVRAFIKWSSDDQFDLLADLAVDENDDKIWKPAFNRLLDFEPMERASDTAGELLGSFFKREEALKAMQDKASAEMEDMIILLLKHEDEDVLFEMCRMLSVIGTEKSISPLERLQDQAVRARVSKVVQACKLAKTEIRRRINTARNADDGSDG